MFLKYGLPILAICGALFGLAIVFVSHRTVPTPPILFPPAISPYKYSIAGTGIIEASSQNISIGTPFNQVITKIYVVEGDIVRKGDLLFELDLRPFQAQLAEATSALKLEEVALEDKKTQFSFYERLKDTKAVSEQIYQQARYAYLQAKEKVKVAMGVVAEAQANIDLSIIRAPIDGKILQVNIHVGEIAPIVPFINAQSTWLTAANGTLILMGQVTPLQVRINIDEADAWRFKTGSSAMAFVRGNRNIHFPLTYYRTEPYIIPKASFTGATVERVDMRVLQVLYQFDKKDMPVYAGQLLDIFIESAPIEELVKQ